MKQRKTKAEEYYNKQNMQHDHRPKTKQQQQQQHQQQTNNENNNEDQASLDLITYNEDEGIKDVKWQQEVGCIHIRIDNQTLQEIICGHAVNTDPQLTPALKRISQRIHTWHEMKRISQLQTADPMQCAAREHNKEADNICNHILDNINNYEYK